MVCRQIDNSIDRFLVIRHFTGQILSVLAILMLLSSIGCQPMPGTTSPGFSSRLGMGPQNRAMGNSAFNSVSSGESAYGRVAFGPQVSTQGLFGPILGGGDNRLTQGSSTNSGAGAFQAPADQQPTTNPFAAQASAQAPPETNPWNQQLQNLSQQVNRYNIDNADLYQQVATLKQQLQQTADTNGQLKSQLANAQTQLSQYQSLVQESEQRLQVLQASTQGSGSQGFQGATIRANNSLLQNMEYLKIPGVTVTPDNDVIRVSVPSDYLFQQGSYSIQPASSSMLNRLAGVIRQYYPSQILGVEAHWNGGQNAISEHQITTGQALAVMNQLVSAGVPPTQLFVIGYGANKPKFSNASPQGQSANRRVELVIYPDKF